MPHLLVGIDTEGDNQWERARRISPTFENIYRLAALHEIFERHAVRPTYVITHAVATDPRARDVVRELVGRGACEVGAHLHPWSSPPFRREDAERHTYPHTLPPDLFTQQLKDLTGAILETTGVSPRTYRAGRQGFGPSQVAILEQLRYQIDSSVAPLFNERHKNGPDFVEAPLTPYFLAYDSVVRSGSSRVLEIPISAGVNRRLPCALAQTYARLPYPYQARRVLRRLGLLRMVWLRPSYSSLADMQLFARRLVETGQPVLNVIFHSSEAIAGGSPYNRTEAEVRAFFDRLERFLAFATEALQAVPATFSEFRLAFLRGPSSATPAPSR